MQCRRVVGKLWGLSPRTMKWVYTAVIRPKLSYAALIWVNGLKTQHNHEKMTKLQRLATKMITGAMDSTPTTALDTIADVTPVKEFLMGRAATVAYSLRALGHWEATPKSEIKIPKKFK